MADFCALNVVSSTDEQISRSDKLQNYSGRARLVSGLWTFQVDVADGVSCPGGGTGAIHRNLRVRRRDAAGTHTSLHGAVCGLQPAMRKQPFSLQLVGPPPSPIQRYPLQCNDIAICSDLASRDTIARSA